MGTPHPDPPHLKWRPLKIGGRSEPTWQKKPRSPAHLLPSLPPTPPTARRTQVKEVAATGRTNGAGDTAEATIHLGSLKRVWGPVTSLWERRSPTHPSPRPPADPASCPPPTSPPPHGQPPRKAKHGGPGHQGLRDEDSSGGGSCPFLPPDTGHDGPKGSPPESIPRKTALPAPLLAPHSGDHWSQLLASTL